MNQDPGHQPVFNVPMVVLATILLLAAIQGGRLLLSDMADAHLLARFAFVPGRLTTVFDAAAVGDHLRALVAEAKHDEALAGRFFLGSGSFQPWTVLTYALLHGSWTHVGLNAIWLLAFGTPVVRRIGTTRFVCLCMAGAVAGATAHYAVDPVSLQPLVGASASVSACMGAALRFAFIAPPPDATSEWGAGVPRRHGLREVFRDRRAAGFLLVWMVGNVVTGVAAVPIGLSDAPIAWQAHIGGFALGLLAFPLFDRRMLARHRP